MNPEDPEQRIRDLERGLSQTPETAPSRRPAVAAVLPAALASGFHPFGGPGGRRHSGGPYGGFAVSGSLRRRRGAGSRVLRLVILVIGMIVVANAVYWGVLFFRGGAHHSVTTVHGHLEATLSWTLLK